jgi:tetratricopeptide (TPR) repeat protein
LGLAHYMLKHYSQALQLLCNYVSRAPNLHAGHAWLAATYTRLGRLDEARTEVAEALRLDPNVTITDIRRIAAFKNPKDDKHFFEGLRKAGLPE